MFALFGYTAGILEVLHCVLVESPEALNIIKEGHIKSIISLLDKHGRNHKVRTLCKPLLQSGNPNEPVNIGVDYVY